MSRACRLTILFVLALASSLHAPHPAWSDVTDGGGSPDFLLKSYTDGQVAVPFEESYEPGPGWVFPLPQLGGSIAQAPAVTEFDNSGVRALVVVALRSNQQVYYATYVPASGWSDWLPLPPFPDGATSAPAVAVFEGRLHVFARGAGDNIWETICRVQDGSWFWRPWRDLTPGYGGVASAPGAATYHSGDRRAGLYVLWLEKRDHEYMQIHLRPSGRWSSRSLQGCCYRSAPAVAQYVTSLQVWGVGVDGRLYQREWLPRHRWSVARRRTHDVIGSAPAILQYVTTGRAKLEVFYVMGDYVGTEESKQLEFDPAAGWQPPSDWVFLSSAPALTQYGTQLQVWAREDTAQ